MKQSAYSTPFNGSFYNKGGNNVLHHSSKYYFNLISQKNNSFSEIDLSNKVVTNNGNTVYGDDQIYESQIKQFNMV